MKRVILSIFLIALLTAIPLHAAGAEQGMEVGGIHILKTDVTGKPLEGAVFQILRETELREEADRTVEKKMVKAGDEYHLMAVMSFWPDREMEGRRQKEVSTDNQGRAAVYGLPYGTYYLLEHSAPEGYNRITAPIRVSIHRYSHLTQADGIKDDDGEVIDNTLHIINVRYGLADTGKWGEIQLTAAGIGILFSSAALILLNRRRKGW